MFTSLSSQTVIEFQTWKIKTEEFLGAQISNMNMVNPWNTVSLPCGIIK